MKLSYIPVNSESAGTWADVIGGTTPAHNAYAVMFDEGSAGVNVLVDPSFAPQFEAIIQNEQSPNSDRQMLFQRSNVQCSGTFVFQIPYATKAASLASIRAFASLLKQFVTVNGVLTPQIYHLKVEETDGSTETQYYPNAAFSSYRPIYRKLSVDHQLSFGSDSVQLSAP